MTIDEFIHRIRQDSFKYKSLYHFTDSANLESIRQRGLLSKAQLRDLDIPPSNPGGDAESRAADLRLGNDDKISLALSPQHPMAKKCRDDGRHPDQVFLPIDLEVLRLPGVVLCAGMANSAGSERMSVNEGLGRIDFEILYTNHGRPFSEVRHIVDVQRKFEILVPNRIDPHMIGNAFKMGR